MTDEKARYTIFGFDSDKAWDYENGFYLMSEPNRISKAIAHWEIYKMVTNLPGDVVECGVYKGPSFIRWCSYRDMLESPDSRRIIGFDAFGKFPKSGEKRDLEFIEKFEFAGGAGISKVELQKVLEYKNFRNTLLIEGDLLDTVPAFLEKRPETRIALLHIDVDIYKPTKFILEQLYSRIVPGGVLAFDDYGKVFGETKAVEDFFGKDLQLRKLPYSHIPTYCVKN